MLRRRDTLWQLLNITNMSRHFRKKHLPERYLVKEIDERRFSGLKRERTEKREESPRRQLRTERRRDADLSGGRVKARIENGGDRQNTHNGFFEICNEIFIQCFYAAVNRYVDAIFTHKERKRENIETALNAAST